MQLGTYDEITGRFQFYPQTGDVYGLLFQKNSYFLVSLFLPISFCQQFDKAWMPIQ